MSFQFANDAAAFIATSRSILREHGLEVRIGSVSYTHLTLPTTPYV